MKQPSITKQGSTALVRAFRKGKLSLDSVMKANKKLKLKPRFLGRLDSGAEGTAYLMTNPKKGVAVMKYFDPGSSYYSEKMIKDKIKLLKRMKGKGYAEYLGKGPVKNTIMTEYVPYAGNASFSPKDIKKNRIKDFIKSRGIRVRDAYTNTSNYRSTLTGETKIIDFLPKGAFNLTPMGKAVKKYKRLMLKDTPKIIIGDLPKEWLKNPIQQFKTIRVRYNKNKPGIMDKVPELLARAVGDIPGHFKRFKNPIIF